MASCFNGGTGWPEPVVRVQAVSDTCGNTIPERYVKPPSEQPSLSSSPPAASDSGCCGGGLNIPVVDLSMLDADETCRAVAAACREWGFFQAVNHGVRPELLRRARASWRGFFRQPAAVRERYANSPATYEGYGSRLGTAKGGPLDWGDYYFLHLLPPALKSHDKWPSHPPSLRETTEEYSEEVLQLARRVMRLLSSGLGLEASRLQDAFGGEGACMRVNFYPRCPQPELTLGVAAHSDPGGMTMLLVDDHVRGLQVMRADGRWITVDPVPDAFIVNVGDQIQVLSNAVYKSVVHRVTVSGAEDRLSMAFFYNPRSDLPIAPMAELVTANRPALYPEMTFDQYRVYIRQRGLAGKAQLESLQATAKKVSGSSVVDVPRPAGPAADTSSS